MLEREITSGSIKVNLKLKASLLLHCCTIALFIVLPSVAHAVWTIQGVDTPKNFSNMSSRSIAIDRTTGYIHIVYGADHLYHAYNNGSQWFYETVDDSPGVGKFAAIAIDPNGKLHISYYDETNGDLKYATNALGVWEAITVDIGEVGQYASIAVGSNNKVHISYYDDTNDNLKYATNTSGVWVTATVDSTGDVGKETSIAVDSNNKAHISYCYLDIIDYVLKYATNASGSWVTTTVAGGNMFDTSIAIDSANKAHISFWISGFDYSVLAYATNASGSWVTTTVDSVGDVGGYTSIAIDSANKVHVSYYDFTNSNLKYATNSSGSWVTTTVDNSAGFVGHNTSIVLDNANKVHISYYDDTNDDLKYAANVSGSWVKTIIDGGGMVGANGTSIAIDNGNKVHISYSDDANADLKYATNTSGVWVTATVDSTGDVGKETSIAVDSNNKAHISYYDDTDDNLKYATNASGSWVTNTVDSVGYVGFYTSMAVDNANKVHISYYDSTNTNLKYATNASGSWVTTTVDSAGDVGRYTSIAIDSSNKAHISYFDYTSWDLKYATNSSGSWVTTTVDNAGLGTTSIALDSASKVHISYYNDLGDNALKYATNASGSWVKVTVDSSSVDIGRYNSIAVDSNNKVHISYNEHTNNYTNEDLKYVTNASGNWVQTTIDSAGDAGIFTSIAIDGSNKVHISYHDGTNYDLKYATNAPIDTTPPVGTITINSNAVFTNSATVTLTLTCGDIQGSCSQMQFSNDGSSWSAPEAYASSKALWDITAGLYGGTVANGLKSVYARFKDSSDNWSDPYSDTITLDAMQPTGSITINSGAASTNTPAVALSLTCNDGTGSGCYQMRFSNVSNDILNESFESGLPSGWTVIDNAGSGVVWRFDNPGGRGNDTGGTGGFAIADSDYFGPGIPMDTELRSPVMDLSSAIPNVTLEFKTDFDWIAGYGDEKIDVDVSINGAAGPWTNVWHKEGADYLGPKTEVLDISGIAAGQSNVMIRFRYYNANWDLWWVIDDVVISSWSNPESVDSAKSWSLSNGDGVKTVYVQYSDIAGSWSSAITETITLDSTPPNAPSVSAATLTNDTTPTWTWSSGGGGGAGTYRYKLNNNDLTTGATETTSLNYTPGSALTEGTHTLYVQERDALSNWSASGSFAITIDITAPNLPTVTGSTLANNQKPTWNWYSGGGGTGNYRYKLDDNDLSIGATTTTSTGYTPSSNLTNGTHTLYVQERDNAYNWSASGSFTTTIDSVAPTGSITINSDAVSTNTPSVALSLTCNDSTGSGCYQMRFSNFSPDILNESFESGLPTGWTVIDNAGTGAVWSFDDPCAFGNYTGGSGFFASVDALLCYFGMNVNTELRTPVMDMSSISSVFLKFKTRIEGARYGDYSNVDISINGAAGPWTNVWAKKVNTWPPVYGPATEIIDITSVVAGQSNVMIRFHDTVSNRTWQVDDVVISSWSNPESVNSTKSWGLSDGDGVKTVYVQYSDIAGNWSSAITETITLDTTPPNVPSVSGATLTNDTTPTWTWSGGGGGSGTFRYKLDDGNLTTGATETTSLSYTPDTEFITDGVHTLYVQEKDALSNWSTSGSFAITIDITAPNLPTVIGSTPTNNQKPTWNWYSGGNGGTGNYRYKLDDSNLTTGVTTTTSTSYTPASNLTDGSHTLYVQERDSVNNWSTSGSFAISIDATPPNTPSVIGTTPTNNQKPTWTWTGNGGGGSGTFRYKLDDSNLTTGATETTSLGFTPVSGLTDGSHTLYVQEKDALSNWSTSGSFAITIDATPPNAPSVTGSTPTNDSTPTWGWSSGGGGGNATFRYKLDNADLTTGATTTTSTSYTPGSLLTDGPHTLYVQERDDAGNWSGSGSFVISIDTTPPNAPSVTGTTPTNNTQPTWSWTINGGGGNGTFRYKLDDSNLTTGATETTSLGFTPVSGLTDGSHTLYVQEKDALSNWSASGSFAITIDATPPNAPAVTGTTSTNNTRPTWSWTSSGGGGNGTYRYKLDDSNLTTGATETTSTSYASATDLSEATHTLYVQERDAVGNWSASGSFAIMIDITQPDSPIVTGTTPTNNRRPIWDWSSTSGNTNFRYKLDNADLTTGATETTATSYTPVSDLSEGVHTLYVQEKDTAGNWSASDSHTILIDITAPSGTISINSGAASTNDPNVTLGLTCNDGTGSGCSQMQFSDNNGTSWTTPEAISTTKSWTLSGDGDRTIYVKFKDAAGNWSGDTAISDVIKLDTAAPVTTPSAGGGEYATTKIVTLTCSDGTGTGCAGTYFTTDGSDPDETDVYSSPVTINSNTILKFYSKDNLGNTETVKTETYTFIKGYTELTLELSTPTIDQGGLVTAWGRLHNMTSNGADPTGMTITLHISDPNGVALTPVTTQISNNLGDFYFNGVSGFNLKGTYSLYASFGGSGLLAAADSPSIPLLVGASAGYAIIIEGKINQSPSTGETSHNKTANRIYQRLKTRGFIDDNIYYFNYLTQTGVDGRPLKAMIQYAIEEWALPRMNGMPAPLYIIMVDHGSVDAFHIDNSNANTNEDNDIISPADLNTWLTTLEGGLNAEALVEKRVVIIGACYSGSFISGLSQAPAEGDGGRVIITSSADDEVSYKGPMEGDNIRSGEFFIEELFTRLERGYTLREAFEEATEGTEVFTRKGGAEGNANEPYYDGAVQHPMLDDNGDAQGSNALGSNPADDGTEAEGLVLGVGVEYNQNSAETPADITEVTETLYLGSSTSSAMLWARVNHDNEVDVAPWMEIRTPSMVLNPQSGSGQEELSLTKIALVLDQGQGIWKKDPSQAVPPTSFTESGKYEVYYFVRDQETKKLSPMKRSVVYKARTDNNPPDAFDLTSPSDGSEQSTTLLLQWEGTTDPDGVTYMVMISEDDTFATIDYIREEITDTVAFIGTDAGLSDLTTYYWKVIAVDGYGMTRESSEVWSFHTNVNNPEVDNAQLMGIVRNAANPSTTIVGASVVTKSLPALTTVRSTGSVSGGIYSTGHPSGTYRLTATAAGYAPYSQDIIIKSGEVTNWTINMTAVNSTPAANFTVSATSGTAPLTVTFTNTTTGGNAPFSYAWDLDNSGSTDSTLQNPLCTYNNKLTGDTYPPYAVKLTVTDNDSDVSTITKTSHISVCYSNANIVGSANTYTSLQSAYNAAATGSTVQGRDTTIAGDVDFNRSITVTIVGGYNCDHSAVTGKTIINGNMTISNGTVTMENVQVQ